MDHAWASDIAGSADGARAVIDLSAVRDNTSALRDHAGPASLMAVVKSDAYGHGMVPCARAALAGGAGWLGVIRVQEALDLRAAKIGAPILCLMSVPGGPHSDAVRAEVDLSVSTAAIVAEIAAAAQRAGRQARLHLKVDTGMARGGATVADWPGVVAAALAAQADGSAVIVGLWSHLACADIPGHPSIAAQLALFQEALALAERAGARPEIRHLANTPATLTLPESRFDLVRTGGGIVGLSTLPGGPPGWLRPAMTVTAPLVQLKQVPPGTAVSYGHRYVTRGRSTLGLIPVGYADGMPRQAGTGAEVATGGRRWPLAGTISMNHAIIDFGEHPATSDGTPISERDEVVLFGPGDRGEPTAAEWAGALGTISYEVVTNFGGRIPRSYREVAYGDDHGRAPWPGGGGSPAQPG